LRGRAWTPPRGAPPASSSSPRLRFFFALFAFAALLAALFFWLEPAHGPALASLNVAAVGLALALIASALLFIRRRAPPPQPSDELSQLVSLLAQAATRLGPRPLLAAAAAFALVLVLSARSSRR